MPPKSTPSRPLLTALGVLAALCGMYIVGHFLRVANSVIAPDLIRELSLTSEQMGVLTGAYFATAALSLIPMGMMIDRFGARIIIPGSMIGLIAGCGWFAAAEGMAGLTAARILMGVGSGGAVVGAVVVCTRWFKPQYYSMVIATLVAVGNVGNMLATRPLAAAAEGMGWRATFVVIAVFSAIAALIGYAVVRDAPRGHPYHQRDIERIGEVFRGVGEALTRPKVGAMLPINFVAYGCMLTILGLWGGPYLHDVHGLGVVERGNVLLAMTLALIAGSLAVGPLDRIFDTRKYVGLAGGLASVAVLGVLAVAPEPALWLVVVLFALLAGLNGFAIVVFTHGRSLFPDRLIGRGLTIFTLASVAGSAVMQMVSGPIVGAFAQPGGLVAAEGYRVMFAFLGLSVMLSLALYVRIPDAKPSLDPSTRAS